MTNPTYKLLKDVYQLKNRLYLEDEYSGSLILDLTEALESALEGLYNVYVNLGEDPDGARNAKELFGPWVGFDPTTHIPKLVAETRKQWEDDYDSDLIKEYERGLAEGREQVWDED